MGGILWHKNVLFTNNKNVVYIFLIHYSYLSIYVAYIAQCYNVFYALHYNIYENLI